MYVYVSHTTRWIPIISVLSPSLAAVITYCCARHWRAAGNNTLERVAPSFGGWYSIGFITLLILVFGGVVSTPAGWTLSLGGWIRTLTYPLTGGPSSNFPQNGRIPTYPGARDHCATPCEGGACALAAVIIGWSRAPAGGHTNASPAPAISNRVGQGRPRSHSHYSD